MVASVFCSAGVLPFDNIKTKLQNQKANAEGVKPYSGIPDCFFKTLKVEGPFGLWAGLPTFYVRTGPFAIITLLTSEFLKKVLIKE